MLIDGQGCWMRAYADPARFTQRAALFLDRDGVLILDKGYVGDPDAVALCPGAADLVRSANVSGVPAIIVTNQSGIGRGCYGWREFDAVNGRMRELLAKGGAAIDAIFACAWHAKALPAYCKRAHPWRKPRPGMLKAAEELLGIRLCGSWMVGDRHTDMRAARAAGLAGGVLVRGGPRAATCRQRGGFVLRSVPVLNGETGGQVVSAIRSQVQLAGAGA